VQQASATRHPATETMPDMRTAHAYPRRANRCSKMKGKTIPPTVGPVMAMLVAVDRRRTKWVWVELTVG
jgi:hypothetical protein